MAGSSSAHEFSTIRVERDARGWDVVSLNRPKHLNALNPTMVEELIRYFSALETEELIRNEQGGPFPRAVLLRGEGRAFCAGLDLQEGGDTVNASGTQYFNFQRRISHIVLLMRRIKQPIVALMHGAAAGGGLALGLAADIRLVTNDFRCNVAMAKIGLTGADIGISYFLPRTVGRSAAAEMMMTGCFLRADRAFQLGFANSVHDSTEALWKAGEELVLSMVETTPPLSLALSKEALDLSLSSPSLHSSVALEDRQQLIALKDPAFSEYVLKGFRKSKM